MLLAVLPHVPRRASEKVRMSARKRRRNLPLVLLPVRLLYSIVAVVGDQWGVTCHQRRSPGLGKRGVGGDPHLSGADTGVRCRGYLELGQASRASQKVASVCLRQYL
jgi:hypothetical protein